MKRLSGLKLSPEREAEVTEELVAHLEDRHRELMTSGMSSEETLLLVLEDLDREEKLGQELRTTEKHFDPDTAVLGARKTGFWRDLLQDVNYGLRMIRRNPGLTAIAVMTIALGIGANTAIFSILNAVILRPLGGPHPERVMMIWESRPREGVYNNAVSAPDFVDWRKNQHSFEDIAAFMDEPMDLTGNGEPERLKVEGVSPSFFRVLGTTPALGHDFLSEEGKRNDVVLLSNGLWQRRFGSDPAIVGKPITLNGASYEVIGVMPPSDGPEQLWYPLDFTTGPGFMRERGSHFLAVFARLKPGVTMEAAQADMNRIATQIERDVPGGNSGHGAQVVSAHESMVGNVRRPLNVLAASVGFVLLIACANVANLLLARGVRWQRELAIRHALGASRFRMVRQFSMECLWLAVLGAVVGTPIAILGTELLKSIAPIDIPRLNTASLDVTVLVFMTGVTLLTALLAGIGPALQVASVDPNEALKETSPAGRSRRHLRNGLIVAEIALAFVLLTGAGLMMRSLMNILNVDPGIDPQNVLTVRVSVSPVQLRDRTVQTFFDQLMDRVKTLPGVTSVGLTSHLPMSGIDSRSGIVIEGRAPVRNQPARAHPRFISADYFQTMKIRKVEGRLPTEQEVRARSNIVVINRTAALRYWPGQSPVGKRMQVLGYGDMREIVGVIDDVRYWGLSLPANPEAYLPGLRSPGTIVIRTQSNPSALVPAIREQIRQLEADLALSDVQTMEEVMSRSVSAPRFYLILLSIFGIVAVILAAAGIYGVISYTVAQGTRDIGVRIALGANPAGVLQGVLRQGFVLTMVSLVIGLAASIGLTRLMGSLLFGVKATDPVTLGAMVILTTAIALLACYFPARRAARIDPLIALRHQ
jgi:putative ABC transport system permease protein